MFSLRQNHIISTVFLWGLVLPSYSAICLRMHEENGHLMASECSGLWAQYGNNTSIQDIQVNSITKECHAADIQEAKSKFSYDSHNSFKEGLTLFADLAERGCGLQEAEEALQMALYYGEGSFLAAAYVYEVLEIALKLAKPLLKHGLGIKYLEDFALENIRALSRYPMDAMRLLLEHTKNSGIHMAEKALQMTQAKDAYKQNNGLRALRMLVASGCKEAVEWGYAPEAAESQITHSNEEIAWEAFQLFRGLVQNNQIMKKWHSVLECIIAMESPLTPPLMAFIGVLLWEGPCHEGIRSLIAELIQLEKQKWWWQRNEDVILELQRGLDYATERCKS